MCASPPDDLLTLLQHRTAITTEHRPRVLDPRVGTDRDALVDLLHDARIEVHDTLLAQLGELIKVRHPRRAFSADTLADAVHDHLDGVAPADYGVWVHYPWARRVVHLLDQPEFVAVRTSRNQYKITPDEQDLLADKRIGVIGLSVGQSIAVALAMELGCGEIRLADFDVLELSNLNRVRAGVATLGVHKAVAAAREIAELDPFLRVTCWPDGIDGASIDPFLSEGGRLDLLIEVCDGLDVKVLARERARAAGIPVVMQTSDRGMIDVERFDREPHRPLLHGLLEGLDLAGLSDLTSEQKVPYVLAMLGMSSVSLRLKASMVEVEQTIPAWPQLAHAVMLGAGAVTDVARRILLDQFHESGRYYLDVEELIADPAPLRGTTVPALRPPRLSHSEMRRAADAFALPDVPSARRIAAAEVTSLVGIANQAPSAGNAQPWQWLYRGGHLYLFCDPSRSSFLDLDHTASYLALGAAAENLIIESQARGLHVRSRLLARDGQPLVGAFMLSRTPHTGGEMRRCSDLAPEISLRVTNRLLHGRHPIAPAQLRLLREVTETVPGAGLSILTAADDLSAFAAVAGAAERIRMLTKASHADFVDEIRWTPEEARLTRDGIDLATVDLTATERAGLSVLRSWPVAAAVRQWGGGAALERPMQKSIESAAAIALLTMPTAGLEDFFMAGRAMQRCWLTATRLRIALQPLATPPFLFGRLGRANGTGLDPRDVAELNALRERFAQLFPITAERSAVLPFRLAVADSPRAVALRRPVSDVLTLDDHPTQRDETRTPPTPDRIDR